MPFLSRAGTRAGTTAPPAAASAATVDATLLQRAIDAVDALVVVASADCTLRLWNQHCADTSGAPLPEVAGESLWTLMRLRSNLRDEAQQGFDRLIAGSEHKVEFASQWLRKDGRKARVLWTARRIDMGNGVNCVLATGYEAARGQRVAREIAETESRFERLLEVLPDPVVVHQGGTVVFHNRAAGELYGGDLTGTPVIDRVAPENRAFVAARMQAMLSRGETVPLAEERHLKLDGTAFDVEVVAGPVTFDGRPAVEVIARDITARKETLAALRSSEERVRAVFDHSALGMIVADRSGHTLESNLAFQRLLGYSGEELGRIPVTDLSHPDDREASMLRIGELFSGRIDGFEMEKRYLHRDGHEVWARVHVSPMQLEEGLPTMSVATVEDITEHKLLEDQVRQASKMEALGRLASGVAHDFNNLLTVVNGYADLLALSLTGDERAEDAAQIRRAGSRAVELTAQLLAFGRRSKPALEPVDLNARIEEMVPMLRRLLGEDMELEVKLDRGLGMVEADPSQLDQLVMNLVVNGRDAMPGGGSLELSTSALWPSGVPARENEMAWARLEIADTGFGMEPDVLEHIFEPFYTTKGQGKGTGLGLATVYGVVRQMGGQIRVESSIGVGTRFIVDLPPCEAPKPDMAAQDSDAPRQNRGNETILLVEDEPAVRDFCKRVLVAEGYQVHAAGPRDAIETAERLGGELDILVTDVVMPDLDGPTIAAALTSRRRSLKVLFMSGYPRDRESLLTGAAAEGAVLAKPFSQAELCEAVRRVLDRPAHTDDRTRSTVGRTE